MLKMSPFYLIRTERITTFFSVPTLTSLLPGYNLGIFLRPVTFFSISQRLFYRPWTRFQCFPYEVWRKVMFSQPSVCSEGGYPSLWSHVLSWGTPASGSMSLLVGGYPVLSQVLPWGQVVPQDRSSWLGLGYIMVGTGASPWLEHRLDMGTPLDWGTPLHSWDWVPLAGTGLPPTPRTCYARDALPFVAFGRRIFSFYVCSGRKNQCHNICNNLQVRVTNTSFNCIYNIVIVHKWIMTVKGPVKIKVKVTFHASDT